MNKDPSLDWREFQVATDLANLRLDVGVQTAGIVSTRSQAVKLIKAKSILLNGNPSKPSQILQAGDSISALVKVKTIEEIEPYDFPIEILHEDKDVIVVNKPAGLVVHPSAGHANDTLINALVHKEVVLSQGSEPFRPGLVHRIDKGTSGLLVLAKNNDAHNHLARQFKNRTVGRVYLAITYPNFKLSTGKISKAIGRDPTHRKRFTVVPEGAGKSAVTNFRVLHENDKLAIVELKLETGRTHQIRVHLKNLGHPIVGDDLYDGQKRAKNFKGIALRNKILKMERFALHASTLSFTHPTSQEILSFRSDFPHDLVEIANLGGINFEN